MKIIDQTPFFKETGEISLVDRGKAIMQFGSAWLKEMEAQRSVIPTFEKILDRNYTLLRNITPPELGFRVPLIIVGPTGVYVMEVTPLTGMFRAKGDQWGVVAGENFKPQKPNLITRTERMARAIQLYLQRQGIPEVDSVEAVLLCSDPAITIDSLRPIIRIVLRDALERFVASIEQGSPVLSPEVARRVVSRLLNPAPAAAEPPPAIAPEGQPAQEVPSPEPEPAPQPTPLQPETPAETTVSAPPPGSLLNPSVMSAGQPRRRRGLTRAQVIALVVLFILWLLIVLGFIFIVIRDLNP